MSSSMDSSVSRAALAPAADEILVSAQGLKKYFPIRGGITSRTVGFVRAVDGVNLDIRRGKTLGLIGESGCGKTTAGRCLLHLLEPTAGRVRFGPRVLFETTKGSSGGVEKMPSRQLRELRKDMQIVFQDPFGALNPRMLVSAIVGEGLHAFRHDLMDRYPEEAASGGGSLNERAIERIVARLMARVGLNPEHLNRFPHEFSGGQRQRICIARALALRPRFVVLDEPTSALDVSVQAQILNLLKELQQELGLTYLFISHHLAVIRHMCDDVAVMYLGTIVEQASNEALFESPKHPYTVALLSAIPAVDPEDRRERIILEGEVPSAANPPSGCRFHTRCMLAVEREVHEAPVALPEKSDEVVRIDDPRAVGRTLSLLVDGKEIAATGAEGGVAYEVDEVPGVGLEVEFRTAPQAGAKVTARYHRYRERCAVEEPALQEASPGHLVACHYHEEVTETLRKSRETGEPFLRVLQATYGPQGAP